MGVDDEGVVQLVLQGALRRLPHGALTLFRGIERILKELMCPAFTLSSRSMPPGETDDLYDEYAPF